MIRKNAKKKDVPGIKKNANLVMSSLRKINAEKLDVYGIKQVECV